MLASFATSALLIAPDRATSALLVAPDRAAAAHSRCRSIRCGAAADLMSDFKTGYMVGAKPSQMFYAQLIGASFGCVIVPACFAVLNAAFEIPSLDGPLKAVFAPIYRVLAVVTTTGGGELPRHIFAWMFAGAALALALSVANALLEARGWRETHPALTSLVPLPMCVGIGMLIPAASSMEMALGGLVAASADRAPPLHVRRHHDPRDGPGAQEGADGVELPGA